MKFEDIKAAFDTAEGDVFDWSEFDEDPFEIPDLPGVVVKQPPQGVSHRQEHREVVVKWTDPNDAVRFFRKTGCYTSWDGYTWDGPFEQVYAREVVRTEWVKA